MPEEAQIYRFIVKDGVPTETVERLLFMAVFTAECEHGKEEVRLSGAFTASEDHRQVVIDGTTAVGRAIAKIFSGLLSEEAGEGSFVVELLEKKPVRDVANS